MFKVNYSKLTGSAPQEKVQIKASGTSIYPLMVNTDSKLLEDMVSKDDNLSLNTLYREIYLYDSVSGPAVDLMSTLPWSDYQLVGIKDKKVMQIYEDSLAELNIQTLMSQLTVSYLVLGTVIGSLIFNESKGVFTDLSIHDPDQCEIFNIPLKGYDPKIDLKISQDMKRFLRSKDPRDREALKEIPNELLVKMIKKERIELEPLSTLYLSRASIPGVNNISYYTRILPIWLIEKALMRGTIIAAWRRQRAITHVTVGSDEWEPTDSQLDEITTLFINADQDPTGAVITTRPGIEVEQVVQGNDFWKVSDDWEVFTNAKMRALGISDAFLSGDANYSTAEIALSVFIENIKALREFMTVNTIYNKIFLLLSKYHEIYKTTPAKVSHRIGSSSKELITADYGIPKEYMSGRNGPPRELIIAQKNLSSANKYLIPGIYWTKDLNPKMDATFLETLTALNGTGVPVTLPMFANAVGMKLDDSYIEALNEDIEVRKKIKLYKDKLKSKEVGYTPPEVEGEDGGGGGEMYSSYPDETILSVDQADKILSLVGKRNEINKDLRILCGKRNSSH